MFNTSLALGFASQGFHVFPLYKSPTIDRPWLESKGWNRFKNGLPSDGRTEPEKGEVPATTDGSLIETWSKNPATVGYGICAPFHIIFDLDVKNGKNGIEEFAKIKAKFGIPNPSIIVRTKSGGLHLYYARDKDIVTVKVGKATDIIIEGIQYPGIDFIANSGYVVGPSALGPNDQWTEGQYLIVKGNPQSNLVVCPTTVFRGQIRSDAASRLAGSVTTADELITNNWAGADDEITDLIRNGKVPSKIPAGRRDSLLTSFIGVLKSRRLPKDSVRILCEKFLDNCELSDSETKASFLANINLDSKLNRFYAIQGDVNDPRVVARELIDIGKPYRLVNQLHGALAIVVTQENPYLTAGVIYTELKARQELAPYAKAIPESENKRAVNPFDLLIRDNSVPKVHSIGYYPKPQIAYIDPADGLERVNCYVPPMIRSSCSKRSDIVRMMIELTQEICGDMAEVYLDFMAHIVQKPWIKLGTAMLIISETHGSGKNTLVQVMKPLIGAKNYMPVSGLAPFVEEKSTVLESNVLVVFNEVSRPANRNAWTDMSKAINKIKTAITENSTQINPKYEKQRVITTYSNFVMLSNDPAPFDLDQGDRRIIVINNDPPKMDQTRFGFLADFAHNEKNFRMGPREYEDCTYELNEYFRSRVISTNLTTGDAPTGEAKREMLQSLMAPPIQALANYREIRGPGAKSSITSEDKLLYIIRNVLGYKDFGVKEKSRYDVFEGAVEAGLLQRVFQKNSKKTRVVTGLPNLSDREDYPLMGPVHPKTSSAKVYMWQESGMPTGNLSDPIVRDNVWSDVHELAEKNPGKIDVMKLVK